MSKNKTVRRRRRSNGEGSIFQRKDGRWVGSITTGFNDDGQQKKKIVYGCSKNDVVKKLSDLSVRLINGTFTTIENSTFGTLMFEWLLVTKKVEVSSRTLEGNIGNFKNHIMPNFGHFKIYEINKGHILQFLNKMFEKKYSIETIKKCKHLLNQFFEYLISEKYITINPTLGIKIKNKDGNKPSTRYRGLKPEVRKIFLNALNNDEANFIKPLCCCAFFNGLRIGECLALTWGNIDMDKKELTVEQSITQDPEFDEEGNVIKRPTIVAGPKTDNSIRTIKMSDECFEVLKQWRQKQEEKIATNEGVFGDLTSMNAYVFANDDGSYRTYSGTRKIFDRFKKRNDLNKYNITFHKLRHTFSNMLFEMYINPKVIQELLGHGDVATTIKIYNSVMKSNSDNAIDKLNKKVCNEIFVKDKECNMGTANQNLIKNITDEEMNDLLVQLLEERNERILKQEVNKVS